VRFGEHENRDEAEDSEPDETPGPVAVLLQLDARDRVRGPVLRDHEPGGDVEQDTGAAGEASATNAMR